MTGWSSREQVLRGIPLFAELTEDELARISSVAREVGFPEGARVVNIGEPGSTLYILLDGSVSILYPARSDEFELARLGPGEFFGEMALFNDAPRAASAETLEPVRALVLEKEDFRRLLAESSTLVFKLLEALSSRIRSTDMHLGVLKEEALRDPLTGLLNRRAFHDRLLEEADRSARYGETFSLLLLDLDHFKSVNDAFGHDTGDEILKWLGRILTEHTRTADTPFRIGGEEFAVLAPATEASVARRVGDRIVRLVGEARPPLDRTLHVTISLGYAAFPENATDPDRLFHVADQALFRAKSAGRNRVEVPESV